MGGYRARRIEFMFAGVLALVIAGCGVPLQDSAEPLPTNVLPSPLRLPTPEAPQSSFSIPSVESSTSPAASALRLRLWFVQDDGLAAVESRLPVGSAPDLILQSLAIGPTPAEMNQGLRTIARDPFTGQALVYVDASPPEPAERSSNDSSSAAADPTAAPVIATVSPAFSALPPQEQILLLGQVVLSLAGAGTPSVEFVDDSENLLAVPLPDGRLLDQPATARDYASLIVRP